MPVFGELTLRSITARLPRVNDLDTEAWELPQVEVLQLAFEIEGDALALLPRSMHPAIPNYVTFVVTRYPSSPVGPFALAQFRLMGRAGAHPRGLVLGAVTTSPEAVAALRARWGFPAEVGGVTIARYHDRIIARVTRGGAEILEAQLVDPEPISGGDLQYIPGVTLAPLAGDGDGMPSLIQVDPHYTFHKAERGRPKIVHFDADAWNAPSLVLALPIAASAATCDTDLPRIRFVMDAEIPVVQGTRRIR